MADEPGYATGDEWQNPDPDGWMRVVVELSDDGDQWDRYIVLRGDDAFPEIMSLAAAADAIDDARQAVQGLTDEVLLDILGAVRGCNNGTVLADLLQTE